MPLEIRELHIRVNVGDAGGGADAGARPPGTPAEGKGGDAEAVIGRCVDEVLRILEQRKER